MKSLLKTVAITSALLLVPAFAFAQETGSPAATEAVPSVEPTKPLPPRPVTPNVKRTDQGVPPAPERVLQTIKDRADTANQASKERIEEARKNVEEARKALDERKAQVQALIDKKPRGAISSSTVAAREEKREEMRDKLEAKKEEVKTRIEAAREKAKEKFGEAVQKAVGNIADRMTKAGEHLTSIASRIDSRIKEYEAKGKDMSISIGLLATARTDIAAAQDKITAVGSALSAALAASSPKEQMPTVRAAVKAAEEALKKAKESLQKTLESVRAESVTTIEAPSTN